MYISFLRSSSLFLDQPLLPSRSDLPYPAGSVLRFLVTRTREGVTRWLPTLIE